MERVRFLSDCLNLVPKPCQVGRAAPCQESRSNVGDRNRENQPLARVPHFLVKAQRANPGLSGCHPGLPEGGCCFIGWCSPSHPLLDFYTQEMII